MQRTLTHSDSFIGSLCREVHSIRNRCNQLLFSINSAKNRSLIQRLEEEYDELINRKFILLQITRELSKENFRDSLSIEFLLEICSRPISLTTYPDNKY